jgi:hypothetical protein
VPSYRPPHDEEVAGARPSSPGSGEGRRIERVRGGGAEESGCPITRTRCRTSDSGSSGALPGAQVVTIAASSVPWLE